jgi:hypothetical protein
VDDYCGLITLIVIVGLAFAIGAAVIHDYHD